MGPDAWIPRIIRKPIIESPGGNLDIFAPYPLQICIPRCWSEDRDGEPSARLSSPSSPLSPPYTPPLADHRPPEDDDVKHLLWLEDKLVDSVVIYTGATAYRRQDGVAVRSRSASGAVVPLSRRLVELWVLFDPPHRHDTEHSEDQGEHRPLKRAVFVRCYSRWTICCLPTGQIVGQDPVNL